MNYIFFILISSSIIIGGINGTLENVVNAIFDGCNLAIKIAFSLIGIMTFWLGLMRIAEKSCLVKYFAKIVNPVIKPLFKDLKTNSDATGNITLSLCANALGLTNAATPIGLKVMSDYKMKMIQKKLQLTACVCF
ncbi:hypothetical protein IKB17_05250 [bacterium]|nr:hypothetical protein [bacterium]